MSRPRRMVSTLMVFPLVLLGVASLAPVATFGQTPDGATRQKEHAKLYHYHTGKNLRQLAATGTVEVVVEGALFPGLCGAPGPRPPYPNYYLVDSAFRASDVVVGVLESCSSELTEDQDFLFTDCEVMVEQVLKDNPDAGIKPQSTIIVTRPGGTLVLNGRTVRAIESMFRAFRLGGRYLLFLTYIPSTRAYQAFADRTFELLPHGVRQMTPRPAWIDLRDKQDPDAFVEEVRAAVATKL